MIGGPGNASTQNTGGGIGEACDIPRHAFKAFHKEVVVAVCDEDILGKQLGPHTKITEGFYKGELVEADAVIEKLKEATTANIFGNEAVKIAVDASIVDPEAVKEIGGVKYSLIFTLE